MNAFMFLKMRNDLKKISGLRVTLWSEHSHQAFGRSIGVFAQSIKAGSGVYIISQNSVAGKTFSWNPPINRLKIYRHPPFLTGQFMHENQPIKTELMAFLSTFYRFFNMLLWPDPLIIWPQVRCSPAPLEMLSGSIIFLPVASRMLVHLLPVDCST